MEDIQIKKTYHYFCKCGRRAQSVKKKNAENSSCSVCRRKKVPDGQISWIGE